MNSHNFLLYTNQDGAVKVEVLIQNETIWLTINQMAELFGIDKSGISRHIKNIFETGELQEDLVVAKIATTTRHGAMEGKTQTKPVMYFNLDMIISVGYRVNSRTIGLNHHPVETGHALSLPLGHALSLPKACPASTNTPRPRLIFNPIIPAIWPHFTHPNS